MASSRRCPLSAARKPPVLSMRWGAGVTNLSVGQRVMAAGLTDTWAEYFLMKAQRAIPLPDSVPDELGCQLIAMPHQRADGAG